MPVSAQRQHHTQSHHSVSPARPDQANAQPAPVWDPALTQQQAWGNQALQRLLRTRALQAKLTVNQPGDPYEREADRVAEQVMRMVEPQAKEKHEKLKPTSVIQSQMEASDVSPGEVPEPVHQVISSPGRPLEPDARAFFEPRFGYDLSQVRIHDNAMAAESTRAVNAIAYTVGRHLVFDSARYAPEITEGQKLLAHELAHFVQQNHAGLTRTVNGPINPNADAIVANKVCRRSQIALARQPSDATPQNPAAAPRLFQSPDPETALRVALETLASIRFVEADRYVLEAEGESREFNEGQYQRLRSTLWSELRSGIQSLRGRSNNVQNLYARTLEANAKYWPVTKVMEYAFGVTKPREELTVEFVRARISLDEAEEVLMSKQYSAVLERLAACESALVVAEELVDAYRSQLDVTAEKIAQGSVVVRNVSLGVLIGIGAVLATPVVAAGLTALGTGTVVTGTGALAGGYAEAAVNVTEQALEGEGFDTQELLTKTGGGMKLGSTAAFSGSVTAGMAGLLDEGITLAGQAWRSGVAGYAGGASGSALGAALEGKSLWEIAKAYQLGGLEGAIGGVFGGASSQLTQGRGVVVRMGIETVGGGLSSGLAAYATGRSPEEIAQAVLIGSITGAAAGIGTPRTGKEGMPGTTNPKMLGGSSKQAPWEVFGEDVDHGIVIFKSGDDYVGIHPEYPDRIFIPQGDLPPKVFVRNPDGTIAEIPWPFHKKLTGPTESAELVGTTAEPKTRSERVEALSSSLGDVQAPLRLTGPAEPRALPGEVAGGAGSGSGRVRQTEFVPGLSETIGSSSSLEGLLKDYTSSSSLEGPLKDYTLTDQRPFMPSRPPIPTQIAEVMVHTDVNDPQGQTVGNMTRALRFDTGEFVFDMAFLKEIDKDLRWVDTDPAMVTGRGTPLETFMTIRQMRQLEGMAGIRPGELFANARVVKLSNIINTRTILELAQATRSGLSSENAVLATHSVLYANNSITQHGGQILSASVKNGRPQRAGTLHFDDVKKPDGTLMTPKEILAKYELREDDQVLSGFDIILYVVPANAQ